MSVIVVPSDLERRCVAGIAVSLFARASPGSICPVTSRIARACPRSLTQWFPCHRLRPCWILKDYAHNRLEPATGVEPAYPAWEAGGLPLTYAGVVPVSPGCQAAASVFALTPMTSGCPASVFPSGFAVCQGLAPCGPTSGHGYAPCGRWRYSLRKASRFSS